MSSIKTGLALGSGGAKGLAHIGFLEVLNENNIKPDFVTGSSMGSFIGGLYALGIDFELVKEKIDDFKLSQIFDFDILFFKNLSFARGGRIKFLFKSLMGEKTFDDCVIPYRCTAVDLLTGNPVVLDSGPLWKAILASCSIPSAFPPVEYNDMLLVDGGVYDRVPSKACYDLGAKVVIGVDVVGKPTLLAEPPKNIVQVIARIFDIMDYNLTSAKKEKCDLMITIQQDDVEALAAKNLRISYEAGRKAAQENIDKIKHLFK